MKVQKVNLPAINPYQANQLKAEQAGQKKTAKSDRLEISSEAKQLSEITSYSSERNERIQEIKSQIDAGTYRVNPEELARNLLSFYNNKSF